MALFEVGDEVRVVDYPKRYPWAADFVSRRGVVAEINQKHTAYGIRGLLPDGLAWMVAGHLESARKKRGWHERT